MMDENMRIYVNDLAAHQDDATDGQETFDGVRAMLELYIDELDIDDCPVDDPESFIDWMDENEERLVQLGDLLFDDEAGPFCSMRCDCTGRRGW